jgi:hypothetical protein
MNEPPKDQPPSSGRVESVLAAYEAAFDTLRQSVDRSPHNHRVVHAIGTLLDAVTQPFTSEEIEFVLGHPAIRSRQYRMWEFLAQAEGAMERHYSVRLDAANVNNFRYFRKSYDRLVDAELTQLGFPTTQVMLKPTQSLMFVEAGPLPLSPVLVHQKTGMAVTCIDADRANADLGRNFIDKCGMSDHITYRFADGDDYDYTPHPIVFVSSFVRHKASIIENICEGGHGVETLAVRSAQGIYTLIYEPVTAKLATALRVSFDRQTVATPETINTTLFASLLKLPQNKIAPPEVYHADTLERLSIWVRRRPKNMLEPD